MGVDADSDGNFEIIPELIDLEESLQAATISSLEEQTAIDNELDAEILKNAIEVSGGTEKEYLR
jgi:hypothetical protein